MNYFFFGFRTIYDQTPEVNRVKLCDNPIGRMYMTHLETNNYFIINGYDFKSFIFHVRDEEDAASILKMRMECGKLPTHVIADVGADKSELLYHLATDIDLSIQVYFLKHNYDIHKVVAAILINRQMF